MPESDARSVLVTVEEGAGKRCSECESLWKKVPESDARVV